VSIGGVTSGGKGGKNSRVPNHHGSTAESLRGAPKPCSNVTGTFFKPVHLLSKDLSFECGGTTLTSYRSPSNLIMPMVSVDDIIKAKDDI